MTMPRFTFENKFTLGNGLTILAFIITMAIAWGTLTSRVDGIQKTVDGMENMPTRMAIVERNQVTGKEQREAFQAEISVSVDELRKQNLMILQQLAAISATLTERGSRP